MHSMCLNLRSQTATLRTMSACVCLHLGVSLFKRGAATPCACYDSPGSHRGGTGRSHVDPGPMQVKTISEATQRTCKASLILQ